MRILIVFATTRRTHAKLATFAADRLRRVGHQVHICDAAQSDMADFARFEAALLIASVHVGRHQASLTKFARANHIALNAIPSAFVSVSLSAAGADPSYPGLRDCVERLERDTFWRPGVVHHAAGAMPFSAYGFSTKFAIKLLPAGTACSLRLPRTMTSPTMPRWRHSLTVSWRAQSALMVRPCRSGPPAG